MGKVDDSRALHFTDNFKTADAYAEGYRNRPIDFTINGEKKQILPSNPLPTSQVYKTYLSIKNPLKIEKSSDITAELIKKAKDKGYDGIITNMGSGNEYVVFSPNQIKSATDNSGAFDPLNPDIRGNIGGVPMMAGIGALAGIGATGYGVAKARKDKK